MMMKWKSYGDIYLHVGFFSLLLLPFHQRCHHLCLHHHLFPFPLEETSPRHTTGHENSYNGNWREDITYQKPTFEWRIQLFPMFMIITPVVERASFAGNTEDMNQKKSKFCTTHSHFVDSKTAANTKRSFKV